MQTTSYWLNKHNNDNKQLNEQVLNMINTTVKQNYFQYEDQIFQPEKWGPPYPVRQPTYICYIWNI